MVMIGYNLIGLVLEAAERYLICIVIIFLSPLALATGVSEESSMIAKNWLKMFWSHGVLLILNIWVVGIGRSCFDTLDPSATTTQIIVWALITYAYFKVAQKLDDMMQNSGMMITRTGGDFVHDATLAVGTIAATGKHLFGGAADTVVAGAGVANAIKSGGGIGDVAKPIASYVKSHPILAPTAGAAATVAGGTAGFAAQVGAAHSLSHTSDEARAASVANGKLPNVNSPAYRTAAQNVLNQNGFAPAKGGTVDRLSVNPDGSLSGVVTQRDATGRVQSQSAFTMSNKAGTGDGFTVSAGRQMTVGADGKSATITDPQAGTFELTQAGTDKYGNQIWQATRTADAGGAALTEENAGTSATLGFNVKPDTRSNDGIGAQAANAFMSGGTMEQLTQQSDEALAHHAQMEADKSAAWGDLNTMGNDDRVAQMRDENSTVDYSSAGYRAATAEYMQQNGLDDGMIERGGEIVAQQVTEDGRLVGCIAVKDAENNALEEKFYSLSTAASSVDSASASAPTMDEVLTAKYQMIDEGHGMVETSDLGKLQVSRVSVNEATGDTKWQVIRKGSESEFDGPESEDAIATFERKGNHGIAQSFKDVIRDIRNTRTFDQISLIDSKIRIGRTTHTCSADSPPGAALLHRAYIYPQEVVKLAANTKWNDDLAQVNNAARQAVRAAKNAKEDAKTVKRAAGKAAAGNWMGAAVDMLKSPRAILAVIAVFWCLSYCRSLLSAFS